MRFLRNEKKGGFTFVEILVAVAVIAVLATVIYGTVGSMRAKARDAQRKSDLEQIRVALRVYKDEYGDYPSCPDGTVLGNSVPSGRNNCPSGTDVSEILKKYLPTIPSEPSGNDYIYDSSIRCRSDNNYHAIIFVSSVEQASQRNWTSICNTLWQGPPDSYKNSLPNPGKPTNSSYGIILR